MVGLADLSPDQLALTSACILLLTVHARKLFTARAMKTARQFFSQMGRLCRHCIRTNSPDKLNAEIAVRTRLRQVDQLREGLSVLASVQVCASLVSAVAVMSLDSANAISTRAMACILVNYSCVLFLMFFPKGLTSSTVNLWFCILAIPLVMAKSPVVGPGRNFGLPRLLLAILQFARMDTCSTVISSIFSCFVSFLFYLQNEQRDWLSASANMNSDLGISTALIVACLLAEHRTRQHVRTALQGDTVQQAFRALLRNFYEVVLELDGELKIAGPAQDFAAFLLYGAGTKLEDRQFQDFVREEDRSNVVDMLLHTQRRQCSMAEVMHAQMRGVDGNTLEAELFFFGFEGLGGYVVGIREYSDEMLHGIPTNKKKPDTVKEEKPDPEEVSVTVDTSSAGFPSLRSTPAFEAVMGPTPRGSSLLPRLNNWQEFSRWVQSKMNAQMAGESGAGSVEGQDVSFKVKFKAQAGVQTRAVCRVVEVVVEEEEQLSNDNDSEDHAPLVAKLLFSDLERCRCRPRSGSSSSAGSLSSARQQ